MHAGEEGIELPGRHLTLEPQARRTRPDPDARSFAVAPVVLIEAGGDRLEVVAAAVRRGQLVQAQHEGAPKVMRPVRECCSIRKPVVSGPGQVWPEAVTGSLRRRRPVAPRAMQCVLRFGAWGKRLVTGEGAGP